MIEQQKKTTPFFIVIAFGLVCCALYGIGAGIRGNIGILLNPLADQCGLEYADVSFCIAVLQLAFGASQPFFGILATKKSNRFVLLTGVVLLATGILGMMLSRSFPMLLVSMGILFGSGTGAIAFGMVLTSAIHLIGMEHAMTISGMLNAAAGMVSFGFAPMMQSLLSVGGVSLTMEVLLAFLIILIPISIFVTSRDPKAEKVSAVTENEEKQGLPFKNAFRNRTYVLLLCGFSTCGFHMVIIESHLFSQYLSYDIPGGSASWAFSIYGVATIFGALLSGYLSTRVNKGKLLSFYYGFRAVWTLLYLFLMPKNVLTAVIFSTGLGLTGDATVSPTSGLVNENFNLRDVATLIGLLFLGHQIGAFLSAWLGGIFVNATGSYVPIWLMDVGLCTFASIMSFLIPKKNEENPRR